MNRIAALALALLCSAIAVHAGTQDECVAADLAAQKTLQKCAEKASKEIMSVPDMSNCDSLKKTLPCTTKSACCSGDALKVYQSLYDAYGCTGWKVVDYCGTYSSAAGLRASFFTSLVAAAASLCALRMF